MFACRCLFTEKKVSGGEEAQKKEAAGENPAEKTLIVMTGGIVMTAVIATTAVVNAAIETVEMTVNREAHPEIMKTVSRA